MEENGVGHTRNRGQRWAVVLIIIGVVALYILPVPYQLSSLIWLALAIHGLVRQRWVQLTVSVLALAHTLYDLFGM